VEGSLTIGQVAISSQSGRNKLAGNRKECCINPAFRYEGWSFYARLVADARGIGANHSLSPSNSPGLSTRDRCHNFPGITGDPKGNFVLSRTTER
jgi:hypothetical protein